MTFCQIRQYVLLSLQSGNVAYACTLWDTLVVVRVLSFSDIVRLC